MTKLKNFLISWQVITDRGYIIRREDIYGVKNKLHAYLIFFLTLLGLEGKMSFVVEYINPSLEGVFKEDIDKALEFAMDNGYISKIDDIKIVQETP